MKVTKSFTFHDEDYFEFKRVCNALDRKMSPVIEEFMKDYLEQRGELQVLRDYKEFLDRVPKATRVKRTFKITPQIYDEFKDGCTNTDSRMSTVLENYIRNFIDLYAKKAKKAEKDDD